MTCRCAIDTDEYHGWECEVTGGACVYYFPNSKKCAEEYGEGPDAHVNKCEDCNEFYLEDNKRCCKQNTWSTIDGELVLGKYIADDTACCGGFTKKE